MLLIFTYCITVTENSTMRIPLRQGTDRKHRVRRFYLFSAITGGRTEVSPSMNRSLAIAAIMEFSVVQQAATEAKATK